MQSLYAILTEVVTKPKHLLRQQILQQLRQIPPTARRAKSERIARKLRRLPLYRKARVILCYSAIDGEVETGPILKEAIADGKRVAVPVTLAKEKRLIAVEIKHPDRDLTSRGAFGILEPTRSASRQMDPRKLDLAIVPGVAFDARGRRLGRGGGYFDRFLARVPASAARVGLAFKFQMLRRIPWETHDQPVDKVITD